MVINPSFPAKTVPEFIAYAKDNPGKINMASAGDGTLPHLAGELFKMMAGVDMVHVPYRGAAPALTDLIGGQVQVYFIPATRVDRVHQGRQTAGLAVTTATRSEALPDIPTWVNSCQDSRPARGMASARPRTRPTEIVDKLNKEINAASPTPRYKARLADLGGTVLSGSPADFGKLIADETRNGAR